MISIPCPLECGYDGPITARETAGVTIFVCPECLGVAFDGGVLCDPRKPVDLTRALKPIIASIVRANSVDPLTQVKNHKFFLNRLTTELANAHHHHFLSVAGFRVHISNIYRDAGGRAGDTVLQSVAAMLLSMVRSGDNFARIDISSGDVFALILSNADATRALDIAERIAVAASNHAYHTHLNQPVSIKIYHAVYSAGPDDNELQVLYRLLDELDKQDHHGS